MIYDPEKHEVQIDFPVKSDFARYYLYSKGEVVLKGATAEELRIFLIANTPYCAVGSDINEVKRYVDNNTQYILESVIDEDAFKAHRFKYYEESDRLAGKYNDDLYKEYGYDISRNVFDICFSEAWARSHSSGYHEVESTLEDVIDFAQTIINAPK